PKKQADFESFVKSHLACRELLEAGKGGAKLVDFQAFAHLPYFTDHYFSAKDRWVLTGEAGALTDLFYSPGSDFIATANEFAVSLILAELRGDADVEARAAAYNQFYK